MSTASSSYQQTPVRVNRTKFLIVQWGGVVLSILLFLLRILVRLKVFRRLYVDDGLVFFAWTLLLTNTIVWQLSAKTLYQLSAVATGAHSPPPADFAQSTEILWPKGLVVIILFLTGLWSIKLSFLVFFKRLGNGIRHQEKIWWAVLVLTVASYLSTFGTIPYSCLTGSFQDILTSCPLTKGALKKVRDSQYAQMTLDVISDALIIVVPTNLLWKIQLSVRKKLALAGIFSISVIIMVFAVLRVALVTTSGQQPDPIRLYFWTSLEQAISIVAACLASFPALFMKSERDDYERPPSTVEPRVCNNNGASLSISSNSSKAIALDIFMDNAHQRHNPAVKPSKMSRSTTSNHQAKAPSGSTDIILPIQTHSPDIILPIQTNSL